MNSAENRILTAALDDDWTLVEGLLGEFFDNELHELQAACNGISSKIAYQFRSRK